MTVVDGMDDEIKELVSTFKRVRDKLEVYKRTHFPSGSVIYVEHGKGGPYTGFGVVALNSSDCDPCKLAVRLGNGNTWWYGVEKCCIAGAPGKWPSWIQEEKIPKDMLRRMKEAQARQ